MVADVRQAHAQLVERGVAVSDIQILGENPALVPDALDNVGFVSIRLDHNSRRESHVDHSRSTREGSPTVIQQLGAFYVHAALFTAGMVLILGVNLAVNLSSGGTWSDWWSGWASSGGASV